MSNTLATTRRQLRNILVPGSQDDNDPQDAGHFPRSKVMRFAFNPPQPAHSAAFGIHSGRPSRAAWSARAA